MPRSSPLNARHLFALTLILGLWVALIVVRLIQLQVVEHNTYVKRARRQQEQTVDVSPVRGVIYDRNAQPLAMSVEVDSVFAVPAEIPDAKATARLLAPVLRMNFGDVQKRLGGSRSFSWIKRKISAPESARLRQLNLQGIYLQKESKRFYPKRELAAHVLGSVGIDDQGLAGIELAFDKAIHGEPGELLMERDARRRWFRRTGKPPVPGQSLFLTLDENIQYIVEQELERAINETRARSGVAVVENPRTGEILALANLPTFNPNAFSSAHPDALRNSAVSGIYEPGSTFKIITMSAALDSKLTTPSELIDCQMGSISVAGHLIRDWHPFGILTVSQAFQNSSDVGAIKLAMRLGDKDFYRYMRAFGFGTPTGIELPGEARGLTKPPERWWKASIGAMAMGQEIGVTPLQMVAAASAVANDGIWVRPHIVMPQSDGVAPGVIEEAASVETGRRVITSETAAAMQRMMALVVTEGTAKQADPAGYSAAGKTGTAQKLDPATGTYSRNEFVASFVGFAPVENPLFTILVVLDSPRGGRYHGGDVAAPVFRRIAEQILPYRNVPGTKPLKPTTAPIVLASWHEPDSSDAEEVFSYKTGDGEDTAGMTVPDFTGASVRTVTIQALAKGLPVRIVGSGIAYEQSPPPDSVLEEGDAVIVRFRMGGAASGGEEMLSLPTNGLADGPAMAPVNRPGSAPSNVPAAEPRSAPNSGNSAAAPSASG